ncbi:MAG: hypothetical protein C4K60_09045 [Ideonella sp. MAG2]|nr:MAG: hypothetical protein C4K60_09045 [Ideonella sp. MAG2]
MNQAFTPLVVLSLVVVLLPAVMWLLRRGGVVRATRAGVLTAVDTLAVSPSQRVVVVSLQHGQQQRWLVLGVGGEHITSIATLDAPPQVPLDVQNPQAPTVAQMISRWRGEPSGDTHAR